MFKTPDFPVLRILFEDGSTFITYGMVLSIYKDRVVYRNRHGARREDRAVKRIWQGRI